MKRMVAVLVVLFLMGIPLSAQEDEAAKLSAVLKDPNASLFAKTLACKEAGRKGTEASVAPLAAVLLDEKLSHSARIGLQQIPGDAATKALGVALEKAKPPVSIGIINSLGERRDPSALLWLLPQLASTDPTTLRATAVAVGKIGDPIGLAVLQRRFGEVEPALKAQLVDGFFACAERLEPKDAVPVYAMVRNQRDLPIEARRGAIRGELLALGAGAGPVLSAEMQDANFGDFLAAIEAGRDMKAPEMTPVFIDLLGKLDEPRKVLLLDLLDCRGDMAAKDKILELAKTGESSPVRNAAIRALAGHPSDDVIAFLLDLVTKEDENAELLASGTDALTRMNNAGLNAKVVDRLTQTKGKASIPLINVCSQRKIAESVPVLIPLLNDPIYEVRFVTLPALGNTVSGGNIEVLIERLVKPASKIEFDTVKGSLHRVCHRTVDQEEVAGKLAAAYDGANQETKIALLEMYGALGGKSSIEAVNKAISDPTEAIQDAATRVLGNWPDPDAAPVLLTVMENPAAEKFHNRALRGFIRVIRQMDTSNQHRFNMFMQAWAKAQRDEEKLLLIDALGRIPILPSLEKLMEFIDTPNLTEAVCTSTVIVGKEIVTQQREKVAAAMTKVASLTKNEETKRKANEVLEETKK